MADVQAVAWLATLQAQFGSLLRTPLDRSTGTLRAPVESYASALCQAISTRAGGASRRLAIYHRQYWFRLFGALQNEYRLCARLLGMWQFNELATRYLEAYPPRGADLQHVGDAFVTFLAGLSQDEVHAAVEHAALCEAAAIDRTFSSVFLAPEVRVLSLRESSQSLVGMQLRLAPSVALVSERWPLIELRKSLAEDPSESAVPLPPRLSDVQHWVIFRTELGHGVAALEPLAQRLFSLLASRPLAAALAELEAEFGSVLAGKLPQRVQALLRDSVRAGFWCAHD